MKYFTLLIAAAIMMSCGPRTPQPVAITPVEPTPIKSLNNQILTAEQQAALTPDEVIVMLKDGNKDFVNDSLTVRNNTNRVRYAAMSQYPKAVILSCLDSRVPVEDIFHRGIGDVFVARVAGNIVNPDIMGSMEFACKVSGSKLILVLGHESCGAIMSAIENVKLGNMTGLLAKIQPTVAKAKASFHGDALASNPEFVTAVCHSNVEQAIADIRKGSPILKEMEQKGDIKIIGGIYDMHTGKVEFMENI